MYLTYYMHLLKNTMLRLHKDERGPELVEQILQIAVIALPILAILYVLFCTFCGNILDALKKITDAELDIKGFCIFGKCK